MSKIEQTLSIIKPDAVERKLENEIKGIFISNGFSILKEKKIQIEKSEAEKFYKVHETKPFYNDLCEYLSSGPILVMVLKKENAVFGELAGWERPNWFAIGNQEKKYIYDWKKQNWFENHKLEHLAIRKNVGLIDMSSFGKIRVEGIDALSFCQRMFGNNVDVDIGKIVYTQMLNSNGGIESDLTVTRLEQNSFLLVVPATTLVRDLNRLNRYKKSLNVVVTDVTSSEAVLVLMGPNSRKLLSEISPNKFDNNSHSFGLAKEIEIGYGLARAHRISYVGELGWELYVSSDQACHVFETIQEAGKKYKLKLCGLHSLDSCRIEKAYRHFGHDITGEDHVLEAGLGFAVQTEKDDFIGKGSVIRKNNQGLEKYLYQFQLEDPELFLFHNEPIYRDGKLISYLTSGNYGHFLGSAIGMGYVPLKEESIKSVEASDFHIEISGKMAKAKISSIPFYDPRSEKVRI